MYNPFKPHIRQYRNGKFGIAKFSLNHMSFLFQDLNRDYWFITDWGIRDNTLLDDPKLLKLIPPEPVHTFYSKL